MKKKILLILLILISLTGCGKQKDLKPDLSQIREISDWITLKAEYHNVAKVEKEAGSGILHVGEVDRKMWIEYNGEIQIGVEADKIGMDINGNNIKISMPLPKVLFINYKDYDKNSYYISKDSWFNKNKLDYNEINEAMKIADENMLNEVNNNSKLFDEAKNNLEVLITNYINKISKLNGIKYNLEFIYN